MAKPDIQTVDDQTLARLWERNGVAEKRANGAFTEIVAHSTSARNPQYDGGVSNIVKLVTPNGQQVGTIHEIVMRDGSVPHSHPKDYTLRDCSRVRLAAEPFQ